MLTMTIMSLAPHGLTPYGWLAAAAAVTGIGMGLSIPASNNASLQLAPDQISAIAGLRGMFRQSGGIIAVSVTTAILSHAATPGIAQAHSFIVFAAVLVLIVPFAFMVQDFAYRSHLLQHPSGVSAVILLPGIVLLTWSVDRYYDTPVRRALLARSRGWLAAHPKRAAAADATMPQ